MTAQQPPGATNTARSVTVDGSDHSSPHRATQGENVLAEIADERVRQDAKWGEQNHPDGTSSEFAHTRDFARARCQYAAANGTVTWRHILNEEFLEALAETDPEALRTELIQVAAVATQWVECIDRRSHPSSLETSP